MQTTQCNCRGLTARYVSRCWVAQFVRILLTYTPVHVGLLPLLWLERRLCSGGEQANQVICSRVLFDLSCTLWPELRYNVYKYLAQDYPSFGLRLRTDVAE